MPRPQLKRADAKAKAEAAGATVGGDVTGKTTLVVNGGDGGAKLEKAKAYNEKHQQRVEGLQLEQQKELDDKKSRIEVKLTKAAERRDEVIEQVK